MNQNIFEIVKDLFDLDELPDHKERLRDFEQWNSLMFLALNLIIEEEYGVEIPRNEFMKLETIGDIDSYLQSCK